MKSDPTISPAEPADANSTGTAAAAVITAYERRMAHEIKHPVFGYRVNYCRALDVQARLLAAHCEIPEYAPFTTR